MDRSASRLSKQSPEKVDPKESFDPESVFEAETGERDLLQSSKLAQRKRMLKRKNQMSEGSHPGPSSDDPVRMYLREMGRVPLLEREGEVEIAKRIETGNQMIRCASLQSAPAVEKLQRSGNRLE